jgi:general secretion pathway protein A
VIIDPAGRQTEFKMFQAFFRFFGLRVNPFNVNPDPTFLFLTHQTRKVLDDLAGGIRARKGLILLTGEAGTGKTTHINCLLNSLQQQGIPKAFIFNSHLEVGDLFELILAEFGITSGLRARGSHLMRLNQWLIERHREGKNAVLIVDEAQGLPSPVLEEIRLLLNLETPHEKLLQIVLSGQPELEMKLSRPEFRQIRQRITLRCKTMPLSFQEGSGYIQDRLRIAGASSATVFVPEAIEAVYLFSRGIPRVMNLLCEQALIKAYLAQIRPVPAHIVKEVASQYQFDDVNPFARPLLIGDTMSAYPMVTQSLPSETPIPQPAAAHSSWTLPHERPAASMTRPEATPALRNSSHTAAISRTPDHRSTVFNSKRRDTDLASRFGARLPDSIRQFIAQLAQKSALKALFAVVQSAGTKQNAGHTSAPSPARTSLIDKAALRWFVSDIKQRFARRPLWTSTLFSRQSLLRCCRRSRERLLAFAASPRREQNTQALRRWLQRPIGPVRLRRRVSDKQV